MLDKSKKVSDTDISIPEFIKLDYELKKSKIKPIKIRSNYKITEELYTLINAHRFSKYYVGSKEKIEVVISLKDTDEVTTKKSLFKDAMKEDFTVILEKNGLKRYFSNSSLKRKEISISDIIESSQLRDIKTKERLRKVLDVHRRSLHRIINDYKLKQDNYIKKALLEGSKSISVKLTKNEINGFLKKYDDIINAISLPKNIEPSSYISASQAIEIPYAISEGDEGDEGAGVKIYMGEASPCPNEEEFQYFKEMYDIDLYSNISDSILSSVNRGHGYLVGNILKKSSPKSILICDEVENNHYSFLTPFPNTSFPNDPGLPKIESYSWNAYPLLFSSHQFPINNKYNELDQAFDNYVFYSNKVVFVSAGNGICGVGSRGNCERNVLSPAKALNVITVGNYDDNSKVGDAYEIHPTSAYKDPFGGYSKPEISAPGTNIEYIAGTRIDVDYDTTTYTFINTGTSFSTPFAAAFAANAMSNNTELFEGGAALMKAYMIASTSDDVVGDGGLDGWLNKRDFAGEGGINYKTSKKSLINRAVKNKTRSEIFENIGNGWYCDTQTLFFTEKDKKYNVALSWLSSGDYALSHQRSELDLNVYITDFNGNWYYSNDSISPYEKVSFTSKTDGANLVYICKMQDYDTSTPINFGLSVMEME